MKPAPVTVATICSLCDQPWEDHGDKPTKNDCIQLLKAALAAKQTMVYAYTGAGTSGVVTGRHSNSATVSYINRDEPPDMGVTANVG